MHSAPHKTQSAHRAARARFALQMAQQAKKVGDRIAYERDQKGWSKAEMARQMPGTVSGNDVYRWESGKHMPRSDTLDAIADLFGISQADLHAGAPDEDYGASGGGGDKRGATQLDRIEAKLDLILKHLGPSPQEVAAGKGGSSDRRTRRKSA